MSDNLCGGGGSNLLKALADQVDRDRSIHQARAANTGASANNVFRAARTGGNAEHEFNAFAQGPAAMEAMGGGGFVTDPIPAPAAGNAMNPNQGVAWVHQFQQMNIGAGVITALPAPGVAGANAVAGPPMAGMFTANPGIVNMGMPLPGGLAAPPAVMHVGPMDPLGGLTQEELDAKFAEFEAEYEAQVADDADFEHHMATWMAEHGPAAAQNEPINTTTTQETKEATVAPVGVKATVRVKATVTEKSTHNEDQDEVAKAAAQIATVMGNDASEKFQNSRFLNLMRRAGNKEVVIEGDNFVDKETHETVATIQYPVGKENQEPVKETADH